MVREARDLTLVKWGSREVRIRGGAKGTRCDHDKMEGECKVGMMGRERGARFDHGKMEAGLHLTIAMCAGVTCVC